MSHIKRTRCVAHQVELGTTGGTHAGGTHATITETMDTYGHLFPDAKDLGRGAIDAVFAVALTEQERNQDVR